MRERHAIGLGDGISGGGPGFAATPAAAPLLQLEGLSKRFGALQALQDVSLALHPGEVHCLLGENGAGKSTLCNLVFGVHAEDEIA